MDPIDPAEIPLRDIHLPEAISWWPFAPGWWLILGGLLALVIAGFLAWRFYARRQVRRAERALAGIEQRYQSHRDDHRLARELSVWARQFALLQAPANAGGNNSIGADWVQYWQQRISASDISQQELSNALTVAPYRPGESFNAQKLTAGLRQAIKRSSPSRQANTRSKQAA